MKTWVFNCSVILVLIILLSFPTGTLVSAGPAQQFTVNSLLDGADNELGDGICHAPVSLAGACTLRAAFQEAAISVVSTNVVVNVPVGTYTLTLVPDSGRPDHASGDLDLLDLTTTSTNTITIIGTGQQPSVIDANHIDRVLHIGTFHKVTLQNLVIQGGRLTGPTPYDRGAGIFIHDRGDITLEGVVVKGNEIVCPDTQPSCSLGGGIAAHESDLIISRSQIVDNKAYLGAALYLRDGADPTSNTTITNSTINGHHGAFYSVIRSGSNLRLINTTMSDNLATIIPGYIPTNIISNGRLWVQNSTLVFPDNGVNVFNWSTTPESTQIRNSILLSLTNSEGVSQGNCKVQAEASAIVSRGANVFSDDTCNPNVADLMDYVLPPGVLTDSSQVLLGPLQYYGGKVKTMAPMQGFVGIDRRLTPCFINIATTDVPQWLNFDARDFPRSDDQCDSGAVEGVMLSVYLPVISR